MIPSGVQLFVALGAVDFDALPSTLPSPTGPSQE